MTLTPYPDLPRAIERAHGLPGRTAAERYARAEWLRDELRRQYAAFAASRASREAVSPTREAGG